MVFIEPKHDTTCSSGNSDVTGTVEIGAPSVCFVIDVGDVKRHKHSLMIPKGQ